jgi:hypothetical protein
MFVETVIPLPREPVEACGSNPLLFFDETSQPKGGLTESLQLRFVNDFRDDYSCHRFFPVIFSPQIYGLDR